MVESMTCSDKRSGDIGEKSVKDECAAEESKRRRIATARLLAGVGPALRAFGRRSERGFMACQFPRILVYDVRVFPFQPFRFGPASFDLRPNAQEI
jgi:hypothetical protein